jgi:hypothetical protein
MSIYTVTRWIKSAVHLWLPSYEIDGITFRPLQLPPSDDLLVSEAVETHHYREASKLFDQHLLPVLDALSLVGGAAVTPVGGSTLIEKKRGKYVLLNAVNERPSARLSIHPQFNTDLLDEAARVARVFARDKLTRSASYYLRLGALAHNIRTATLHTLQAAEALIPRLSKPPWTDHKKLRTAMGAEFYEFFYKRDPTLGETRRNALAHGRLIDEDGLVQRTANLRQRLLTLVRGHFGVPTHTSFTPLRGFTTYETFSAFLEPLTPLPPLPDLVAMAVAGHFHSLSDPRWVGGETGKRLVRTW